MPRTILLTASFPAAPDRLFDMYLDAKSHSAFTGMPVTIEPRAGGAFSAFEGKIWGEIIHIEPKRLIVQTWRSLNWPTAQTLDSILVLSFWPEKEGGRVELVQANVPDEDFAGVSQGWTKFYWNPWREFLERNP